MDFSEIYNEALIRAGSHKKLMELLPKPCSSDLLSKISDDRYLSTMARCIFRAGFVSVSYTHLTLPTIHRV